MKNNKVSTGRGWIYLIGVIVILAIVLRFGLYYLKSGGFSGLSMAIPLFAGGSIIFALLMNAAFSVWVYQDCKKRNDVGVFWVLIMLFTGAFLGILIYFLRRPELKSNCKHCGHAISLNAKYCDECGSCVEKKEGIDRMEQNKKQYTGFLVIGMISTVLMFVCLTGVVVSATSAEGVNSNVASDKKVWNMGSISMNEQSYSQGVWKLDFNRASEGFIAQQDMKIENADKDILYADISCATVPEGASLVLWMVQGEVARSVDVTKLSETVEYPLSEFDNGKVYVRLQINGVKDTRSEICIK